MFETLATNPVARSIFLLAVFVAAVATIMVFWTYLQHRSALQGELAKLKNPDGSVETVTSLRTKANDGAWARIAHAIEAAGLDLTGTRDDRLTARLRMAGYNSPFAPRLFTLTRLALIFVLPAAYLALVYLVGSSPNFTVVYIVGALLALLGLFLPSLYIKARSVRRQEEIVRGFPDCLDLMIICVQSGLGIEAALDRVGREMALTHPLIAELLSITTLHLRAGASREDAFRKLAELAGVDEVRSFATLIIQSDKLGTSITASLRVYSAEMREMRHLRAEEKAQRLPVLISFPLVACMLPVMIGVLMLPAVVQLVRSVIPMLFGG
jgi:tight adherence protein C